MARREKILVIGGEGAIGRPLADRLLANGHEVIRTSRKGGAESLALDLSGGVSSFRLPPDISLAYICAGATSIEECRVRPEQTRAVNVIATLQLAERMKRRGIFVVFLSSNLVFDGSVPHTKPNASTNPRVEYGRQKVEVEEGLLQHGEVCSIVRITKVLSPGNALFRGWRNAMLRGTMVRPFSDMVMAPVRLDFAAEALVMVGVGRIAGIVQISAAQDITYEQAARRIATAVGASQELIIPARANSVSSLEWVPKNTTLDSSRLTAEFEIEEPDAWSAITCAISDE
jgi:dTDP-4-dehydrorhamnose reductase